MTDIARLGFSANTGDLSKAKAALETLVPSAVKAEKATENFNRAAEGTGSAASKLAAAAQGAASGTSRLATAAQGATQKTYLLGNGIDVLTGHVDRNFVAMNKAIASWAKIPRAADNSASALKRLGTAANDNINRLQSTPGNIAAQFQDVAVTAAGGMNPMLIALQQGTQLSSAMAGGMGNLIAGFKQLFSVTTLLTVGLVGLAAAGLQNIDWMGLAVTVLNAIADGLDIVASHVEQYTNVLLLAGAAALVAFGPSIIASVVALTVSIAQGLVTALSTAYFRMVSFAILNPFGALTIGIIAVIALMTALNDTFGGVFTRILGVVKTVTNFIIGALVGAFNTVTKTWEILPSAIGGFAINTANLVISAIEDMVNGAIGLINDLTSSLPMGWGDGLQIGNVSFGRFANPLQGAVDEFNTVGSAEMAKALGKDWVGAIGEGIAAGFNSLTGMLRGFASGLGADETEKPKTGGAGTKKSPAESEAERIAKAYLELVSATQKRIKAVEVEISALERGEYFGRLYRNEQELIAQAVEKNIPLTKEVTDALAGLAKKLTDAEIAKSIREATNAFEEQVRALEDDGALIGKVGQDLIYAQTYQDLYNRAINDGVIAQKTLNGTLDEYLALLRERASTLAYIEQGNRTAEFMAAENRDYQQRIFLLERERGELNLTGAALQSYRAETDLLLSAMKQGIELGPENLILLQQRAVGEARITEEIRKQREQIELNRDRFHGFFKDMLDGLRQGQSVWEAFGNAVMRIVDSIIDRLLFSEGGGIDSLMKAIGLLGGGGAKETGGNVGGFISSLLKSADGNAFNQSGHITKFAKGGAFTNGLYDSPTLFKFAKGGSFGVMGEAGAEAVMPLKRGPDGSLGVQMHGPQAVRVLVDVNDDRFDAYVDDRAGSRIAETAPVIADAGAKKAQQRMTAVRRRTL